MIPGEILPAPGDITLNADREAVTLARRQHRRPPDPGRLALPFRRDQRRARLRPRRRPRPPPRHPRRHRGALRARPDPRGPPRPLRRRPPGLRLQRRGDGRPGMTAERHAGSCQCGAVAFEVDRRHLRARHLQLLALPAPRLAASPSPRARTSRCCAASDALTEYTLQPPQDPAPVLPHLRHPDLRLRRRARRHADGRDQRQLPRRASTRGRCPPGTSTAAPADAASRPPDRPMPARLASPPASARTRAEAARRGARAGELPCRSPSWSWRSSPTATRCSPTRSSARPALIGGARVAAGARPLLRPAQPRGRAVRQPDRRPPSSTLDELDARADPARRHASPGGSERLAATTACAT